MSILTTSEVCFMIREYISHESIKKYKMLCYIIIIMWLLFFHFNEKHKNADIEFQDLGFWLIQNHK